MWIDSMLGLTFYLNAVTLTLFLGMLSSLAGRR
jgi:hypothetical protein